MSETTTNAVTLHISKAGLEPETAKTLEEYFAPFYELAEGWKRRADGIIVTATSQVDEMAKARAYRLDLKNMRVKIEKMRKELKEDSLRKGQTIDKVAKILTSMIEPTEEYLQLQEDFAKIQEANRREELVKTRSAELIPFLTDPAGVKMYDLGGMPEEVYQTTLSGIKVAHEQRVEKARLEKEEQARIAREKTAEDERIRLENERLKKEGREREEKLKAERLKNERLAGELEETKKAAATMPTEEQIRGAVAPIVPDPFSRTMRPVGFDQAYKEPVGEGLSRDHNLANMLGEFYADMKKLENDPARGGKQATLIVMYTKDIEELFGVDHLAQHTHR